MNCKPGDLAIIIGEDAKNPGLVGAIVEVLCPPPAGPFELPDGTPHKAVRRTDALWVIRFTRPYAFMWSAKKRRPCMFAVCPDVKPKPLPGEPVLDAEPAPPVEVEVPA